MVDLFGMNDMVFTFYMRDGKRLVQRERSVEIAMRTLNIPPTDVLWYDSSLTDTHDWNEDLKKWIRRHPF